jgi:hypothetical protein
VGFPRPLARLRSVLRAKWASPCLALLCMTSFGEILLSLAPMSQDGKEGIPVSVVALRADAYSPNGNLVISLRTKFSSAERRFAVPIECFQDFIVDLRRLNASQARDETDEPLLPLESSMAAE